MSEESRRILDLLAQGKLTVDEADQLLRAVSAPASSSGTGTKQEAKSSETERPQPRYLRIAVKKARPSWAGPGDAPKDAQSAHGPKAYAWPGFMGNFPQKEVTIRVPIALVKSGMRLGAIVPGLAGEQIAARLRERGIDVDVSKLDPAAIDALFKDFGEVNIDVDSGNAQVRISCE
jgi:hypothetical protein